MEEEVGRFEAMTRELMRDIDDYFASSDDLRAEITEQLRPAGWES